MDSFAEETNRQLRGTVIEGLLSETGRRFYAPRGLSAQIGEARIHAHRYNASIGMASREDQPLYLPSIRKFVPELSPEEIFSYAPPAGIEDLRFLWAEMMIEKNPGLRGIPLSKPLVVPGLTSGITIIADLFVDRSDTVYLPETYWGNYRLIFEGRRGADLATYPIFDDRDRLDVEGLERALQRSSHRGKVVLILNYPHNPTGYTPTDEEVSDLVSLLARLASGGMRLLVVTDDAYFGLFYEDDCYRQSLFTPLADLHENLLAVKVDGPTKEDLVWGFRIGFLTFASKALGERHIIALSDKLLGAVRSTVSNSNRLSQSLLLRAMRSESYASERQEAFRILEGRYREVKRILATKPPLPKALPFNSGYFMTYRIDGAERLRRKLLLERGVGTISLEDRYLRVAYCNLDDESLEPFYDEVYRAVSQL